MKVVLFVLVTLLVCQARRYGEKWSDASMDKVLEDEDKKGIKDELKFRKEPLWLLSGVPQGPQESWENFLKIAIWKEEFKKKSDIQRQRRIQGWQEVFSIAQIYARISENKDDQIEIVVTGSKKTAGIVERYFRTQKEIADIISRPIESLKKESEQEPEL
jgi:stress-induced morphogen